MSENDRTTHRVVLSEDARGPEDDDKPGFILGGSVLVTAINQALFAFAPAIFGGRRRLLLPAGAFPSRFKGLWWGFHDLGDS
jgi:hypothetical protein